MSVTSAPSRHLTHPAAGRARYPVTGPSAAGRFRGDLTTEQWWWSPELHTLLGLATGSVRPSVQALLASVHPDDRPAVQEALLTASETGSPVAREHRVVRADGSPHPVLLVCEPEVGPDETVTALSGLVLDLAGSRPATVGDEQLRHLETEVEQLRSAMASRASIEQAKGILMLLMGCSDQVAFDLLAHISSHTHRKVRDVAVAIVESASGHAQLPDDVREILHDACPPARSTV